MEGMTPEKEAAYNEDRQLAMKEARVRGLDVESVTYSRTGWSALGSEGEWVPLPLTNMAVRGARVRRT